MSLAQDVAWMPKQNQTYPKLTPWALLIFRISMRVGRDPTWYVGF